MAALTLASGLSSLMPQGPGSYLSTSGSRELRQWTVVHHRLPRSAPFSLDAPAAAPPTSVPAYSCAPGLPPVGTFSTVCVSLAKLQANQKSADFLKQEARFYKPPINVTFAKLPNNLNHVGVEQLPCNHCGDCVWGCNNKAKNTTLMNYLPDACNHGAQIFCQAQVRHLERDGDGWIVRFQYLDSAQGRHVWALHRPWGIPYGVTSELKGNTQVQWSETLSADDPNYPLRVRNGYVKVRLDGPQISETFIGETGAVSWSRP